MTLKEYMKITEFGKMEILVSPGRFLKLKAVKGKWGSQSWNPILGLFLDKEICKAFVMSNGTVRFTLIGDYMIHNPIVRDMVISQKS